MPDKLTRFWLKGCKLVIYRPWICLSSDTKSKIYQIAYRFTSKVDETVAMSQETFLKAYR